MEMRSFVRAFLPAAAALFLIMIMGYTAYAGENLQKYGSFRYIVIENEVKIIDFGEDEKYTDDLEKIVIPDEVRGMKVTALGPDVFSPIEYNCGKIRCVVCPDNLECVDMDSFRSLDGLKTIVLGKNSKRFLARTDHRGNAVRFTTIKVPAGSRYLKTVRGALYSKDGKTLYSFPPGKSRKTFRISSKTETISRYAFYLSQIRKLTVPKGVKRIQKDAFLGFDVYGRKTVRVPSAEYRKYKKVLRKYCTDVKIIKYSAHQG